MILKELLDNSLDAAEDARILQEMTIALDDDRLTVSDNLGRFFPPYGVGSVRLIV